MSALLVARALGRVHPDMLVQLVLSHLFGVHEVPLLTDLGLEHAHHAHQECTVEQKD